MWGCLCLKVKRLHIISFQIIELANSKPCLHVNQHEIPLAGGGVGLIGSVTASVAARSRAFAAFSHLPLSLTATLCSTGRVHQQPRAANAWLAQGAVLIQPCA